MANTTVMTIPLNPPGFRYFIPIKGYFALMNIVVLCLLFPTISYFFYNQTISFKDSQLERTVNYQTNALEQRASLLLQTLSRSGSQAISDYNYSFLTTLIGRAVSSDPELLACQFFSAEERTVATGIDLPGMTMKEIFNATKLEHKPDQPRTSETDSEQLPVLVTEYLPANAALPPLLLVKVPVNMGGKIWGFVYAAFSLEHRNHLIEQYRQEWDLQIQQYRFFMFGVTGLFFILGVTSAILFTRPLVSTIEGLRDGVDRVAGGDLSHSIGIGRFACREFASLGQSFNTMTDNLRLSRKQLDEYAHTLEEKVEERTRDLQEAQAELLNQAHEAGMAEMAVGVLHNIGNAITPAKVEAQVLAKQLHDSRLRTGLAQALEPLPNLIKEGKLPTDEKERLHQIISLLPTSVTQEFDQAIAGLTNIRDKHHYIENIISLQMHYARLHGTPDLIDCNLIIADSLKILDKQLHLVEITTDLQSTTKVCLEESKLLQILVNLIKNSSEAMADNDIIERTLLISSADHKDEVVITVADNGCGFEQEIKEKLFRFGYSSKSRGSGFGLHSSANYLIANNGSITASSEGTGKGAVFCVHLPTAKPESGEHKA
jgi:nitrogen fixation/metabolism regulation signal transduction histidine kinase